MVEKVHNDDYLGEEKEFLFVVIQYPHMIEKDTLKAEVSSLRNCCYGLNEFRFYFMLHGMVCMRLPELKMPRLYSVPFAPAFPLRAHSLS